VRVRPLKSAQPSSAILLLTLVLFFFIL
jgi:hypothetical protein